MRLYPASSSRLTATIAGDLSVLALLVLFAWLGFKVHDGIAELAGVGRGIESSGRAISGTAHDVSGAVSGAFDNAGGAVQGAPIVGGQLSGALRNAGHSATRPLNAAADQQAAQLIAAGREQERRTYALAKLIGWLTFLIPAILLLSRTLPPRVAQVIRMSTANRALRDAPPNILAARAAYNLPYRALARHTPDPFGDLAAGRHAGLLAALAEDAGVPAKPLAPPLTSTSR